MNNMLNITGLLIVGFVLGVLFFGGLWFTVRKALASKIPALWFFFSFILRSAIILFGFYYISLGNWQKILVCLLGFIVARYVVKYVTKTNDTQPVPSKEEVSHET